MKYELLSTRHAKYLLHAHMVFTPKYRKKIFTKEHLDVMREVFENICKENDGELVEFDGEEDHVVNIFLSSRKKFLYALSMLSTASPSACESISLSHEYFSSDFMVGSNFFKS